MIYTSFDSRANDRSCLITVLGCLIVFLIFGVGQKVASAQAVHDSGPIIINDGIVEADGPDSLVQNGDYVINGGELHLNNYSLTMSSLSGSGGTILLERVGGYFGTVNLTIDQDVDTVFSGDIKGHHNPLYGLSFTDVVKDGDGILSLTGNTNLYSFNGGGGVEVRGGEIFLLDGGTMLGDWLSIGTTIGTHAAVRVSGNSSKLTTGWLDVGSNDGLGNLFIEDGAQFVSQNPVYISSSENSQGHVWLKGNSLWDHKSGVFHVGSLGHGELTVTGGSRLLSSAGQQIVIGVQGHGVVHISEEDSVWETLSDVVIGDHGIGELHVSDGGMVNLGYNAPFRDAVLGNGQDGTGIVTVTGQGSTLDVNSVIVGRDGYGNLSVQDGAYVNSFYLTLGERSGSQGVGVISGPNTDWNIFNEIVIGGGGEGSLTVADGATLGRSSGNINIILARDAGSFGLLRIGDGEDVGHVTSQSISFGEGNGVLEFDHEDADYFFSPFVSSQNGNGHIVHKSGTTRMNALNFSGQLVVEGGTLNAVGLLIAGNLRVHDGGVFIGNGYVGDTVIMDGGTLTTDTTFGTLTVEGDLTIAPGATVDFHLGEPGSVDFPTFGINNRVIVEGDLTLGGTLNLFQSQDPFDGSVGLGYYRLMTYDGSFTDDGFNFGDAPNIDGAGYDVHIGDGRIDLFVGSLGSDELQHWQGGDGLWNDTTKQWLNKNGELTVAWAGNTAVFKDSPGYLTGGTITVDGTQEFLGLQFVDDGYRLEGDGALETQFGGSEIRMLADRAEIFTEITGNGGIHVTSAGTLALSGTNTYTGGTSIRGATVEVVKDENLGDVSSDLTLAGGTLKVVDGFSSDRDVRFDQYGTIDVVSSNESVRNTLSLYGKLTGDGSLRKNGGGELVLWNDANDYNGGTIVTKGVISVKVTGALGSGPVTIEGSDSLLYVDGGGVSAGSLKYFVTHGGDMRFLNGAEGGEAIIVVDEDSRMLFNDVSKAGGAQITNAGEIAFRESASAEKSTIDNQGELAFHMVADAGEARIINRSGGTVRFFDDSNATQAVIVNEGDATVDISASYDGLNIGSLSGEGKVILGDNVLTLGTLGENDVFGGVITDYDFESSGSLIKTGTGTLTLTGDHDYAGSTLVSNGRLKIDGSIAPSSYVTVQNGAALEVNGTVSSTIINSGGTFSGSGTVDGDLTMQAGSRLEAVIDPTLEDVDAAHGIRVHGTVNLEGGTVVHVGSSGIYKPYSRYRILSADSGLVGSFADVTSDFAFLTPSLDYDYDDYSVNLRLIRNDIDFTSKAKTSNQWATAQAAANLDVDHPVYEAIALLPDDEQIIGSSLDSLSGEIHASLKGRLIHDVYRFRSAFQSRQSRGDWGHVVSERGTDRGDANAATVDRSTIGFVVGKETEWSDPWFNDWIVGLAFGNSRSWLDVKERSSSAEGEATQFGFYAGTDLGRMEINVGWSRNLHSVRTERTAHIGDRSEILIAEYATDTTHSFGEVAYSKTIGNMVMKPFIAVDHSILLLDEFSEKGGDSGLSATSQKHELTTAALGLRAKSNVFLGGLELAADTSIDWSHRFGDFVTTSKHSFAGGDDFTIDGVSMVRNAVRFEAGLAVDLLPRVSLNVRYSGQVLSESPYHTIRATLGAVF